MKKIVALYFVACTKPLQGLLCLDEARQSRSQLHDHAASAVPRSKYVSCVCSNMERIADLFRQDCRHAQFYTA